MQSILLMVGTGDKNAFMYLNHRINCRLLDKIMPVCTFLGGATFTVLISTILMLFGKEEFKAVAVKGSIALAVSFVIGFFLKKVWGRPRPYLVIPNTHISKKVWKDCSFPSGHTAAGFSLAVNYTLSYPQFILPLVMYGLLVGVSRIYLGQHYPTDILAGAILGALMATTVNIFIII